MRKHKNNYLFVEVKFKNFSQNQANGRTSIQIQKKRKIFNIKGMKNEL